MQSNIILVCGASASGKSHVLNKCVDYVTRISNEDPASRSWLRRTCEFAEEDTYSVVTYDERQHLFMDSIGALPAGVDKEWFIDHELLRRRFDFKPFALLTCKGVIQPEFFRTYSAVHVVFLRYTPLMLLEADRERVKKGNAHKRHHKSPTEAQEKQMEMFCNTFKSLQPAFERYRFRLTLQIVSPGPRFIGANKLVRSLISTWVAPNVRTSLKLRNMLMSACGNRRQCNDEVVKRSLRSAEWVSGSRVHGGRGDDWYISDPVMVSTSVQAATITAHRQAGLAGNGCSRVENRPE